MLERGSYAATGTKDDCNTTQFGHPPVWKHTAEPRKRISIITGAMHR
jgi:hypothetical protein